MRDEGNAKSHNTQNSSFHSLKGIVHPKMDILLSFTHHHALINLDILINVIVDAMKIKVGHYCFEHQ